MGAALLRYRREIDALLADAPEDVDWARVRARHVRQIGCFQHERLVHLLVTLAFGLFALMSVLAFLATGEGGALRGWTGFALCALLLGLLVPYIRHYFLLENNVQALYAQADRLDERAEAGGAGIGGR